MVPAGVECGLIIKIFKHIPAMFEILIILDTELSKFR
jgi:hypothetical protein